MATQKILLNFVVDPVLLKRIEDFRFRNRFATRAAAIKWLLDWSLKQKPVPKDVAVEDPEEEVAEAAVAVAAPIAPPSLPTLPPPRQEPVADAPAVSLISTIQALRDQGYEVGEIAFHPGGIERIAVRSQERSAWVNVKGELQDLAAGRLTLAEVAARRTAGR